MAYFSSEMPLLKQPKIMELLKKIDQDIESTVRGAVFYNKYLESNVKAKIYMRENDYTKYCFRSKYKSQLEDLGLSREDIEHIHGLMTRKQTTFTFEMNRLNVAKDIREEFIKIEKKFGNPQRLKILEATYNEKSDNAYYANTTVAKLTRWNGEDFAHFAQDVNYFNTNNSIRENDRILEKELHNISFVYGKKDSLEKQKAIEGAFLWDRLRREGANLAPEKMEKLIKHERNHQVEAKGIVAVVKVGEINEKLGIIKQPRAAEVFPEYESVKKHLQQLVREETSGEYDKVNKFITEERAKLLGDSTNRSKENYERPQDSPSR